jgi:hypothetical protein
MHLNMHMRIADLTEYNKGDVGEPLPLHRLQQIQSESQFVTHFFRDQQPVKLFQLVTPDHTYFTFTYEDHVIGYFWCVPVTKDILQIKSAHVFPPHQNKGMGTEARIRLVRTLNKRFIHDTQLSDQEEHVWRVKLPAAGVIRGIYDRESDTTYGVDEVGNLTSDGVTILDPSTDQSDPFTDYDHGSQRFFWIMESEHDAPTVRMMESHARYHDVGAHELWMQDPQAHHAAHRSTRVIHPCVGF